MSLHIDTVFVFVPFKFHVLKIIDIHIVVNIKVCDVVLFNKTPNHAFHQMNW